jgi:transcriptional regulator with XRE-family HTH domain
MKNKWNAEKFQRRLVETRTEQGLTQLEVGRYLHTSSHTISNWEQGRTFPRPHALYALCELYDISADWLLGLEGDY